MSITKKFDSIGYYYTFEYYLYEQELDYTILEFLDNGNGINLGSLTCFFDIIKNNVRYIITTNSGYYHQVISIAKSEHDTNSISDNVIFYNGYIFNISDSMELKDIEVLVKITTFDVTNYENIYHNHFDKVKSTYNKGLLFIVSSLRPISIMKQTTQIFVSTHANKNHITKLNISKLDMRRLFPNLQYIYDLGGKIIYENNNVTHF
jgi:hypothetical protein